MYCQNGGSSHEQKYSVEDSFLTDRRFIPESYISILAKAKFGCRSVVGYRYFLHCGYIFYTSQFGDKSQYSVFMVRAATFLKILWRRQYVKSNKLYHANSSTLRVNKLCKSWTLRILVLLVWITAEIARFMQYSHPKICSKRNIMIDFRKILTIYKLHVTNFSNNFSPTYAAIFKKLLLLLSYNHIDKI